MNCHRDALSHGEQLEMLTAILWYTKDYVRLNVNNHEAKL